MDTSPLYIFQQSSFLEPYSPENARLALSIRCEHFSGKHFYQQAEKLLGITIINFSQQIVDVAFLVTGFELLILCSYRDRE